MCFGPAPGGARDRGRSFWWLQPGPFRMEAARQFFDVRRRLAFCLNGPGTPANNLAPGLGFGRPFEMLDLTSQQAGRRPILVERSLGRLWDLDDSHGCQSHDVNNMLRQVELGRVISRGLEREQIEKRFGGLLAGGAVVVGAKKKLDRGCGNRGVLEDARVRDSSIRTQRRDNSALGYPGRYKHGRYANAEPIEEKRHDG